MISEDKKICYRINTCKEYRPDLGKAKIGKVNVDEEPELAAKFGIASIPTVMVFQDGKATNTSVGYRSKAEIAAMLKETSRKF